MNRPRLHILFGDSAEHKTKGNPTHRIGQVEHGPLTNTSAEKADPIIILLARNMDTDQQGSYCRRGSKAGGMALPRIS